MAGELDPRAAGAKRFAGKVCVVTGSGQGIGRATARRMGEEGGTIVVAERVDESATRTVNDLQAAGVEATKVLADVGTFAGAKGLMDAAVDAYGRIDVLVNNVGGTIWAQPYHRYTDEQVNHELERTLYPTSVVLFGRAAHHDGATRRGHRQSGLSSASRALPAALCRG